jgi:hypothetical protein
LCANELFVPWWDNLIDSKVVAEISLTVEVGGQ